MDLWETGIKLMVVYPGVIDTPLFSLPDNDIPNLSVPSEPVRSRGCHPRRPGTGAAQVYVPEYFRDICTSKAQDVAEFWRTPRATCGINAPPPEIPRAGTLEGNAPREGDEPTGGGKARVKVEPEAAGMSEARLERITEHFERNYVTPGKIAGCQITVVRGGIWPTTGRSG